VSSAPLERMIDAARAAGALGAKLSGGGRGGNVIALVRPKNAPVVQRALLAAGAVRVIVTEIS
jgi:mevalonate kinase